MPSHLSPSKPCAECSRPMASPRALFCGDWIYSVCSGCFEHFASLNVCEDCGVRPTAPIHVVAQCGTHGLIYVCKECGEFANTKVATIISNWPQLTKHASYFRDPRIPSRRGRTEAEANRRYEQCAVNVLIGEYGLSVSAALAKRRQWDPMAIVRLKDVN